MPYSPFYLAGSRDLEDLEMYRRSFRGTLPTIRTNRSGSRRTRRLNALLPERLTRRCTVFAFIKWVVAILLVVMVYSFTFYKPHVEIQWYSRHWVEKQVLTLTSLGGCFNTERLSPSYNLTLARGPKRHDVHAGLPMRFGLDCYDYAGTIQPDPVEPPPSERNLYHTYWRVDLAPFEVRQEWMIKSFFATQDLAHAKMIMWSNGDLKKYPAIKYWLERYPNSFEVRLLDIHALAHGTALENSPMLTSTDSKAWTDGDVIRLLLLWNYGGIWVDMDSLLTRDLATLFEHEFVTQWDCYGMSTISLSPSAYISCLDKKYQPFNGALMRFRKHSPYLCEFFYLMANSPRPRLGSTDWGSFLYFRLWRRLVAAGIPPFKILPFCFSDGRSCRMDNRLPDPFVEDAKTWANGLSLQGDNSPLKETLDKVFAIHLHNQWQKSFPPNGWVERYLLKRYDKLLKL